MKIAIAADGSERHPIPTLFIAVYAVLSVAQMSCLLELVSAGGQMHPSEVNLTPTFSKAMRIAIRFARMGLVDSDSKFVMARWLTPLNSASWA